MDLHVTVLGSGPPVVLVHGAMTSGLQTWDKQRPLADRWKLVIPERRGYAPNPVADRSDFEVDATDLARLLDDRPHLVGHSYGAVGATLAAAARPDAVRSLTVIEPPFFALVRDDPGVEADIASHAERNATIHDPEAFLRRFLTQIGAPTDTLESPLPEATERRVRLLMNERPPWEARIPVEALRRAPFPKLVVTGGHSPQLDLVGDTFAQQVGAELVVIRGKGHVVQRTGEPFNAVLEQFLVTAGAG